MGGKRNAPPPSWLWGRGLGGKESAIVAPYSSRPGTRVLLSGRAVFLRGDLLYAGPVAGAVRRVDRGDHTCGSNCRTRRTTDPLRWLARRAEPPQNCRPVEGPGPNGQVGL